MSNIHPSAVIEPGAQIDPAATVGPLCYVAGKATIGPGTRLVSHVSILGRTTLGSGNTVWPQVTLGADPQDLKYDGEDTQLIIGDDNAIHEGVTIHLGTEIGGGVTRIGDANLIMVNAHIAHDCVVGNHTIISNLVQLAGHIHIEDHAVLSGLCGVAHFVTIGQYAFIGGMTRVVKDAPPFMVTEGNPAKVRNLNVVLLRRHQFEKESINNLRDAFKTLYRADSDDDSVTTITGNIEKLENTYPDDPCVMTLVEFIRRTTIGLHGRYLENERADDPKQNPVK